MTLTISDPAIFLPGISLLFLAYTNRYLALAGIVRQLNDGFDTNYDENREKQIQNLLFRIELIRFMQLFGILSFILCTISICALLFSWEVAAQISFGLSVLSMFLSLCISFVEVAKSGDGLRLEIERTHKQSNFDDSASKG